jgi:predicted nucleic acid-binding protein
MPADGAFLDSNVVCYLFGADPAKADRAGELLSARPTISVQVLAEICNVARRKARRSWPEIEEIVEVLSALCDVVPLTAAIQAEARAIAARTGYTIYDAQILAAAAHAGCSTVWSEDLHDGHALSVQGQALTIRNPFAEPGGHGT